MMQCVALLMLVLSLGAGSEGNNQKPFNVTYIGNEGFLITMGGTKVLIDALHKTKHYATPSDTLLARMIDGVPPFGDVDYVLVTHDHADHFNAEIVTRFLAKHPETQVIASPAVIGKLASSGGKQLTPIDLKMGQHRVLRGGKAEIVAWRLDHSGSREIDNLAFLVRSNGYAFLHVGDALLAQNEDRVRAFDWSSSAVDLLFIEYFDRGSPTQEIIRDVIKPKHVVLMHIAAGEEESVRKEPLKAHPFTVVFGKELETRQFGDEEIRKRRVN